MPDNQNELDFRPDYGFERFDRLIEQLKLHIPDRATHAAVVTALEEAGRDLDLNKLAAKHHLSRKATTLVRQLARFGDVRHPFYAFGSLCVAMIAASREHADAPTTYIMVTRRHRQLDYWWIDTADSGFGALGIRDRPLTVWEAVIMVGDVIAAQAHWDVVDGADRSAYALGSGTTLRITSRFYPRLQAWVRWWTRGGRRPE